MADESNDNTPELTAGEVVGEYRIESKLGEGGFGTVYRAVHPLIGKAAAIKVLHRQYSSSPQMLSRFVAEARAVNQIRHRNIIDIFSFGALPDGRQYYVMELLEGMPFDQYIDQRGPLPPEVALPILRQIARALDAAHHAGIAHRDLKPENIFLVMDEENDIFPKLLDFGIAKLLHDEAGDKGSSNASVKTRTGTPLGTPYFMSPEQCRGQHIDHRTDIYSFGVMTFKALTGELPFDAPTVVELLYKHLAEAPPPPSRARPALGTIFDAPILRMLEKDPASRPPSVTAAADALLSAARAAGIPVPGPMSVSGPNPILGPDSLRAFSEASGPTSNPVHGQTASTLVVSNRPSAPPSRRVALVAGGLAALGLLGAIGWGLSNRPLNVHVDLTKGASAAPTESIRALTAPATTSAAAATPTPTASLVPSSAPASGDVELTLTGAPASAEVFLGALRLGTAPGPLRIKQGTTPLKLTVKASGYTPLTVEFTPVASGSIEAPLTKVAGAAKGTPRQAGGAAGQNHELENPF